MPEVICNTSPLQYLHQAGLLHLLPALLGKIIVLPAVVAELSSGREGGLDLPSPETFPWVTVQAPQGIPALPLVTDLGPGEAEVLALALERPGAVAILDDALARKVALAVGVKVRGTLGLLLDAKRAGHLGAVAPALDTLHALGFRLAPRTRAAVLDLSGEKS